MGTLLREFRADVERTFLRPAGILRILVAPLHHAGLRAVLLYRIAHRLHRHGLRAPAGLLKRLSLFTTGAEIHPAASIGPGLHLPHPIGVVIGDKVVIDGQATLFQDVVLGPRGPSGDCPRLAIHTFVYPGARVLGKVAIGARTQIGPNAVLYRDVPEGSTVLPPEPTVLEGLSFGLRFDCSEAAKTAPAAAGGST